MSSAGEAIVHNLLVSAVGGEGNARMKKAMREDEKVSHFVSFCLTAAQEGGKRDRMAESGTRKCAIMA